jgi:hypothetical protein
MIILDVLQLSPMTLFNIFLFVFELFAFIIAYNKMIKKSVNQDDLKNLKGYVDQQDRGLHYRVDKIEERLDKGLTQLQTDVKDILKILSKN